jgi:TatD DNase family protein
MHSVTPELTDSHCHLDFPDFDGEVDAIIARARAAGVTRMVHDLHQVAQRAAGPHPGRDA